MSLIKALNSSPPMLMAILNLTPDSFSDGGKLLQQEQLKRQLELCAQQQVDILDIGGESTRPGAHSVGLDEELSRVMPAIELAQRYTDCYISVDTYKPEVMRQALSQGVDMINDVNALQAEGAIAVLSEYPEAAICLMHKQGDIATMQQSPSYNDVVSEVMRFLTERVQACRQEGILPERICLDPGFGFGKTLDHNTQLFRQIKSFHSLGHPLLVGVSRKSMLGALLNDLPVNERMLPSVVAAVIALSQGAQIIRVHDVVETRQAWQLVASLTPWLEQKGKL
ncbi:dihydropteroate synthase [Thiomicrospira aerophila AL3]|uniref:Dihydropteroate synthase n=1 Tax=Thiomicrospira aerophila AL3 TaxID=717772 RepID=W0DS18_9GAMM|nr:dihydropteroate synthase [Thiomicrospira aerophila]AHF01430.1 dihydropteroate synthase [Thiomicrospira aerophila AL3]